MARLGLFLGMKLARAETNARKLWVLLGLLALCFAAALPLFADTGGAASPEGAGFETVLGALKGSEGLEVRDEINRPVSRARVERDVRAGAVAMLRQGASYSRESALRALLDSLERLDLMRDAVRPAGRTPRGEEFTAFLAREVKAYLARLTAPASVPSSGRTFFPQSFSHLSRLTLAIPLRC